MLQLDSFEHTNAIIVSFHCTVRVNQLYKVHHNCNSQIYQVLSMTIYLNNLLRQDSSLGITIGVRSIILLQNKVKFITNWLESPIIMFKLIGREPLKRPNWKYQSNNRQLSHLSKENYPYKNKKYKQLF